MLPRGFPLCSRLRKRLRHLAADVGHGSVVEGAMMTRMMSEHPVGSGLNSILRKASALSSLGTGGSILDSWVSDVDSGPA